MKHDRNPYQYTHPVSGKLFVGRHDQVNEIADRMAFAYESSFAIIGGRRFGKTSFLEELRTTLWELNHEQSGDWTVIPIAIDFKVHFGSEAEVYSHVLKELDRRVNAAQTGKHADSLVEPEDLTCPAYAQMLTQPELSFQQLLEGLKHVLETYEEHGRNLRIALLLDEVDEVLDVEWGEPLFDQLRTLIVSSDIRAQIGVVLFGSYYMYRTKEEHGSPLLNVVDPVYLECVDRQSIKDLVALGFEISDELIDQIWLYSGGHPHLAQYLLQHLWKSKVHPSHVKALARRYATELKANMEGWLKAIGKLGCLAYSVLIDSDGWIDEAFIAQQTGIPLAEITHGLTALRFHGFAVVSHETYADYCAQGALFENWFRKNRDSILESFEDKQPSIVSPPVPPTSSVFHIGGGPVVFQAIDTHGGQVSQFQGLTASEVSDLFKGIYAQIRIRPQTDPETRSSLEQAIRDIQTVATQEAENGPQVVNKSFLEERLRNLQRMAPDIAKVVLATFTGGPLAGLSATATLIAEKVKEAAG